MSNEEWYYVSGGSQQGPVTLEDLKKRKADGELAESDLVWKEGFEDWIPSKEVAELGVAGAGAGAPSPAPEAEKAEAAASSESSAFGAPTGTASTEPSPSFSEAASAAATASTAGAVSAAAQSVSDSAAAASTSSPTVAPGSTSLTPSGGGEVRYAGFWLRFVAALIDGILLAVVNVPLAFVFGGGAAALSGDPEAAQGVSGLANILGTLIYWLYFAFMESSSKQASLGKLVLGLKVTDVNGDRLSFGRATGRHFARYISMLTLFIGYIMAGFTEKKQALHDIIASTLVVRK